MGPPWSVSAGMPEEAVAIIEREIARLRRLLLVEHSTEHEEAIHEEINSALDMRERVLTGALPSPEVV